MLSGIPWRIWPHPILHKARPPTTHLRPSLRPDSSAWIVSLQSAWQLKVAIKHAGFGSWLLSFMLKQLANRLALRLALRLAIWTNTRNQRNVNNGRCHYCNSTELQSDAVTTLTLPFIKSEWSWIWSLQGVYWRRENKTGSWRWLQWEPRNEDTSLVFRPLLRAPLLNTKLILRCIPPNILPCLAAKCMKFSRKIEQMRCSSSS